MIPLTQVLDQYVATRGNIDLTAERLSTTKEEIIRTISTDPAALQNITRTFLLMTLFESFTKVSINLNERIQFLEPSDLAKTFVSLSQQISVLTAAPPPAPVINQQNNISVTEAIFNELPPQAQKALQILRQRAIAVAPLPSLAEPIDDDD